MLQGYIYICGGSICMSAVYHVPVNTLHTTFMIILTCHVDLQDQIFESLLYGCWDTLGEYSEGWPCWRRHVTWHEGHVQSWVLLSGHCAALQTWACRCVFVLKQNILIFKIRFTFDLVFFLEPWGRASSLGQTLVSYFPRTSQVLTLNSFLMTSARCTYCNSPCSCSTFFTVLVAGCSEYRDLLSYFFFSFCSVDIFWIRGGGMFSKWLWHYILQCLDEEKVKYIHTRFATYGITSYLLWPQRIPRHRMYQKFSELLPGWTAQSWGSRP